MSATVAVTESTMDRDALAQVLLYSGILPTFSLFSRTVERLSPQLRVINYHGVPERFRRDFVSQLRRLRDYAPILHPNELADFHAADQFVSGLRLLLTFDDGLLNHYTVVADCLEDMGLRGLFFIPVGFVDMAARSRSERVSYFRANIRPHWDVRHRWADDLLPMSWEMVRELVERGHAIGSHTWSHQRLGAGLPPSVYRREILEAADRIEDEIGAPLVYFGWPFGDPEAYSSEALTLVRRRHRFGFSTFALPLRPGGDPHLINRVNLEAGFPTARLRLALDGFLDVKMYPRWAGVRRRLALSEKG